MSKAKSIPEKTSTVLTGVAGEYFVAAELSRRGYIASISLRNTRGIDILVTNAEAKRSVTIQCKAKRGTARSWILNKKCETYFAPNHFYIFVGLGALEERPIFHIVPSDVVAKFIAESHQRWLKTLRRDGKPHADSDMRKFDDHEGVYSDRWDLLGL